MKFNLFSNLSLTYIANSGVMISSGKTKLVIDAVFCNAPSPFTNVSNSTLELMKNSKAPYDGKVVYLFTHDAPDHFDAAETSNLLNKNKKASFILPRSCASILNRDYPLQINQFKDLRILDIPEGNTLQMMSGNIPFEIYAFRCDANEKDISTNYTYMFEVKNKTFLVLGDALPSMDEFERSGLFNKKIDFLIAPFTYIGTTDGREIIDEFNASQTFICHLPDPNNDTAQLNAKTLKVCKKYENELPKIVLLNKKNSIYKL